MAFIKVTSTSKKIKIDFGAYAGAQMSTGELPLKRGYFIGDIIFSYYVDTDVMAFVPSESITMPLDFEFDATYQKLKVDSVNGVAPTSNEHLYNLLNDIE